MATKFKQTVAAAQHQIIAAAQNKLGRKLTAQERRGIEGIHSPRMLEACKQGFASALVTPTEVLADLEYFAKEFCDAWRWVK